MFRIVLLATVICGTVFSAYAEENAAESVGAAGKYPLTVCPISGETLGGMGEPVTKVYDGREVKFCCGNCVAPFEKDLASSMKNLDQQIIASQKASYPLETCVVSGEKLGGMGEPVAHMYKNQLVMFCCDNCISTFEKSPDKYLSKIEAAAKQAETEHKE
ncbi:hypothetical protein KJZ99_04645 [bacterium]|nr:hypothetical protein [bacterium]